MISRREFQRNFVENMNNHRLWSHPFFDIIRSNPSLNVLRAWAIQAGRIDQAFVAILEKMLTNREIGESKPLAENLDDELGNGNSSREHFALFKNVLSAINVPDDEYKNTALTEPTKIICDMLIFAASAGNPLISLGMMANEELICPKEFPPFYEALQQFAQLSRLTYFPVHIEADVHHSEDLINLCYAHCKNDRDIDEVFMWQLVDLELNVAFYDALIGLTFHHS